METGARYEQRRPAVSVVPEDAEPSRPTGRRLEDRVAEAEVADGDDEKQRQVGYLGFGYAVFQASTRRARRLGVLGDY